MVTEADKQKAREWRRTNEVLLWELCDRDKYSREGSEVELLAAYGRLQKREGYSEGLKAASRKQCSACKHDNPAYLESGVWIHSFGAPDGMSPMTDVCYASCMHELLAELDREESAALQEGERQP